jgi:hypothetical protein
MFPARTLPNTKLKDVHARLSKRANSESIVCKASALKVHLASAGDIENAVVSFPLEAKGGRQRRHKVPATKDSLIEIGNLCGVPIPFFKRQDVDIKALLLNALLEKQGSGLIEVKYNDDDGIVGIEDPQKKPLDPRSVVEIAARVLGEDAQVVEWWLDPKEFRLDAYALTDKVQGKGGHVGDITRNGLRFGQDIKVGRAPWVQSYFNRKVCTNGMEVEDSEGVFDGRNLSIEQTLAQLEEAAMLVFSRGPDRIKALYDLQNEVVRDPALFTVRLARENGIAPRFSEPMIAEQLPSLIDPETGTATMFDIVNLVTNQALNPDLLNRAGSRRKLEQAGGKIVTEHVERCRACQTRLNVNP